MMLDYYISPDTNTRSRWIKSLNLIPEILKLPQENLGDTLQDIGVGKNFLNRTKVQEITPNINRRDYMK